MSIQDISCLGKCSLTAALPIISAAGVECSIVPTAVLSTHTQFNNFTFRDLTSDLEPIREHWEKEAFKFDGIYTGYLGSKEQIDLVIKYFDTFGKNCDIIVDPAMADNGKLYTGFDEDFPEYMAKLCSKADIILPNISEAALMLGAEYPGEDAPLDTIKELLFGLKEFGPKLVAITGVELDNKSFGVVALDTVKNKFFICRTKKVDYKSHGTGDVFASSFVGALANDFGIKEALQIAADFTAKCIQNTIADKDHINYGVNFEAEIPYYLKLLKKI